MNGITRERKLRRLRSAIDFDVVGDNITDIADFTVEKYEFTTQGALSPEVREEAVDRIKLALRQRVEEMALRRKQVLDMLFEAAETALHEVVGPKN